MYRLIVGFLVGVIIGSLLSQPALAQNAALLFGSFNGAARAVQVNTNGYLQFVVH